MSGLDLQRGVILLAVLMGLMVGETRPAAGVQPDEILADPVLEARAREISAHLRCLVCRNESIDQSEADLARDLRLLVRERIRLGESDAQVIAYIRNRYGDYVLLNPPLKVATVMLWGGPALLFIMGGWLGWRRFRHPPPEVVALGTDEQHRVTTLLETMPKDDLQKKSDDPGRR